MTKARSTEPGSPDRRSIVLLGALAGAVGVVCVMPFFYPLGRVFDPTIGGDTPSSLLSDLVLGSIGGVLLSPVAALFGSGFAFVLYGRRIGPFAVSVLTASASGLAVAFWYILNGGFADETGSLAPLMWIAVLGALAGLVSVAFNTQALKLQFPSSTPEAPRV